MTRERLIEKAIAEWFEQSGWEVRDSDGSAIMDSEYIGGSDVLVSTPRLAAHLNVELDRILREATNG